MTRGDGIRVELVERLVAVQFPHWGRLPVTPVERDGWDNRTFRLGDDMAVRLPSAAEYAPAVRKENRWLPWLAPALPVAIPTVLAVGKPGFGYPYPWSVRKWLPGETADRATIDDPVEFAAAVAEFLRALQGCDTAGAPAAGDHSFHRGASPVRYDQQTRRHLDRLGDRIDTAAATVVWERALAAAARPGTPVWFHGDLAADNLLVDGGKLTAVIDFGLCGIGDPACDLTLAWTMLSGPGREAFRRTVGADDATWARARGWALWKALLSLAGDDPAGQAAAEARVGEILADHERFGSVSRPAAAR
ncbi:aminoglycoside phosphotransferase family protein [Nocardia sp. alder85J]|uniref:aminoglycoside phosphotransferase family protein n=1 Tax=Nocardia sp. alder85J TaxID=2862949 RepID=UPI001CD29C1A|nr:aminoglycoside phosphotransferase family protein [Nocardia sp. alder85J]MCX4098543.1 aminoglycoside phosphotransferase family protein [Nocardia sp. alder85J]